jgi:hypothetical protein
MRPFKLLLCLALLLSFGGCQKLGLMRFQSPDKDQEDEIEEEQKAAPVDLVGDYAAIYGNNVITIHGVGLVVNLDNTGEDPPPSMYRTQLLQDMQRRQVKNPNEILQSPNTAMVLITAYLPIDIQKGDPFDVEVRLPDGTSATSLAGGWLMEAVLSEKAIVPGQGELKGHEFGKAKGPILISTGEGDQASLAGVLKRGRVLGGGVAFKDRTLGLYLRSDYRNLRNSRRITDKIGQRFHYYEHGQKRPMAKALTDQKIELKVHPRYKDNYPRYMQVVRNIAFRENPVQQRGRMEQLKDDLAVPESAARAAIQLEALGNEGIPILKGALTNSSAEVRFYAAEALAYLGEESGAEELAAAARNEPAFRVYAFAALAALDEAISYQLLRELLDVASSPDQMDLDEAAPKKTAKRNFSMETRYGAFRALWTLDRNDPFIRGTRLNDQFNFHVLKTEGEPLIHMTRNRLSEVVLFGADQRFSTPLALTAGNHINVNAPAGSETITVTRFELGSPDQRKVVSTRVADVILTVAEMGGTYPDVAQMLSQADRQFNLPGSIAIDALPKAGRLYYRPVAENNSTQRPKRVRVGKTGLVPNLFPATQEPQVSEEDADGGPPEPSAPEEGPGESANNGESANRGEASLADVRESGTAEEEAPDQKPAPKKGLLKLFRKSGSPSAEPKSRPEDAFEIEQSEPVSANR